MQNVTLKLQNGIELRAETMSVDEALSLGGIRNEQRDPIRALDDNDLSRIVACIVAKGDRILAVKYIRATLQMPLKESKDWVDARFPRED